jgi:tRNA(Ile)-lysidine synthase
MSIAAEQIERFRRECAALTGGAPLGVAVSGGPDSLALLLLAHAAFPGAVAAATVDHGLRAESAAEARFVGEICADRGIPHAIIAVEIDPARSSRQRAAREARYRALAAWCEQAGLAWLATGHHLDDQAETLVMRLLRGSGVSGLAGIRAAGPLPGSQARLIRPLLGWRREALGDIVAAAGLEPVSDPSNRDARYDRVRIRRLLAETPCHAPDALARSAAALAEAEPALDWAVDEAWRERVIREGDGFGFEPAGLPAEIVRRLLCRMLGGTPRGDEIQRLIARLDDGKTATLAGFRCTGGPRWRLRREGPRRQLPAGKKA